MPDGSKGAGLRAVDWDAGERGEAPREGVLGLRPARLGEEGAEAPAGSLGRMKPRKDVRLWACGAGARLGPDLRAGEWGAG